MVTVESRALTSIHQIECTSRCSLTCVYCPSREITRGIHPARPAMDMSLAIFERALEWASFFVKKGTQHELNLAGIGESMLHPEFVDFVRLARQAVGSTVKLILATNGLHVTDENAAALAPFDPWIYVSMHRPEKGAPANAILRKHGIKGDVTMDGAVYANDWAGQVQVPWKKDYKMPCQWINEAKGFVLSDGRIGTCCLEATGTKGILGHVTDPIGTVKTQPYSLCAGCYQVIDGWDGALAPVTLEARRSS